MAGAMIGGILNRGLAAPEEIIGSAKTAETNGRMKERFGIHTVGDNRETAREAAAHYGWSLVSCARDGRLRTVEDIHEELYALVRRTLET